MARSVSVPRVETNGLAEGGDGLDELPLAAQGEAEVGPRIREIGIDAQGLAAVPLRFDEQTGGEVDGGEIAVEDGVRAVDGQGLVDEVDRFAMPAALVQDHTQQVQRVGMPRRLLEDVSV